MKLSIIISVYNSHEAVRRQIEYFKKKDLPDTVEIIFVDDGSNPPISGEMKNFFIHRTNNALAWTQGLGRNLGASKARGEYLFMTDMDHIISKEAIEDVLNFTGNKMIFRRQIAVLLGDGTLTQERDVLKQYGYEKDNLDVSVHGNTFAMRKTVFDDLGGYSRRSCTIGYHPARRRGDDCYFNAKWNKKYAGIVPVVGRDIYMFPIGRFHKDGDLNPMGMFHNLSQTKQEKHYKIDM